MENKSTTQKLQELFELYQSGALTKEEFDLLKSDIIQKEGVLTSKGNNSQKNIKHSKTEVNTNESTFQIIENSPNPIADEPEINNQQNGSHKISEETIKSHIVIDNPKNHTKKRFVFSGILFVVLFGVVIFLKLFYLDNKSFQFSNLSIGNSLIEDIKEQNYSLILQSNDSIFLFSNRELESFVYLVDFKNIKVIQRKTQKHLKVGDTPLGGGAFDSRDVITYVGNTVTSNVNNTENYRLAILTDSPANVELIDTKLIDIPKLRYSIDSLLSSNNLLKYYFNKADQLSSLKKDVKTKLEYFEFKNNKYYIFTYQADEDYRCKFIIINNRITLLDGLCASDYTNVFSINGENLYLWSKRGQCGSGESVYEVFEIINENLILRYADGSFSM